VSLRQFSFASKDALLFLVLLNPIRHYFADKKREESISPCYSDESDFSDDQEDENDYRRGGYHPVRIGETFKEGRYTVIHKLGWGHFSTVWLVSDAVTGGTAAVKVVKSASHYTDAARDEVRLLSRAKAMDPEGSKHCCRLLDSFDHVGPHGRHVCMVFEVLGDNLLTLIRSYNHRGIPLPVVRHLIRQVLVALDFLHKFCGIIHTDLKPENVMLNEPLKPRQVPPTRSTIGLSPPSAEVVARASGKIAVALAAGQPLTKNQKKKLRKRLQKQASDGDERPSAGGAEESDLAGNSLSVDETSGGHVDGDQLEQGSPHKNNEEASSSMSLEDRLLEMQCKVVDFGNACWADKHFTDDIQTRQYRAPEVSAYQVQSPHFFFLLLDCFWI